MHGCTLVWGAPDFGHTLRRQRLVGDISRGGRDLRLLVAPSGWGKSIAAAEYAAQCGRDVLWLDAYGHQVDFQRVPAAIVYACQTEPGDRQIAIESDSMTVSFDAAVSVLMRRRTSTLIVIDDVPLNAGAVQGFVEMQQRLAGARTQLLITTKSQLEGLCERSGVSVTGVDELRLSLGEAVSLARMRDPEDRTLVDQSAVDVCDGHVALFSLMKGSGGCEAPTRTGPQLGTCVSRLLAQGFNDADRLILERLALVRWGLEQDLRTDVTGDSREWLEKAAQGLPLLRVSVRAAGARFSVHDSAVDVLLSRMRLEGSASIAASLDWALEVLGRRGDFSRAVELLRLFGSPDDQLHWLAADRSDLLERVNPDEIKALIEQIPLHMVMGSAETITMWAQVLYSLGEDEEAIAKARAACRLAEFAGSHDSVSAARIVWIDSLCRLQRFEEALQLATMRSPGASVRARMAEAVVAATVHLYLGGLREAKTALETAAGLLPQGDCGSRDVLRARHLEIVVAALQTGDYARMAAELSIVLPHAQRWESDRLMLKGNLGFALVEMGRIDRAEALLVGVMSQGSDSIRSLYLVALGGLLVAEGSTERGLQAALDGLELGAALGSEFDIAGNRAMIALMMRGNGDLDGALGQAERAFERLSSVDYMGYRRLAALEIAASLLSLDDVAAARRWVETVDAEGFADNAYHALRAAMVLAECDRRDGDLNSGIACLADHGHHILSESSNWQMAMYCRAFPHLLGMLAASVGADRLPIHMLRMVLPEYAEPAMRACKSWLEPTEWRRLGRRVMGDTDFACIERRGGEPICRVRLFGGLDVSLADRALSERDWKKRKARLLFAMLVARRGQDVPRDQVLEYLWPDLSEERARNNFYVAWSAMKAALMGVATRSETCPYLENKGGRLRIATGAVRSDIDEFEEALAEARDAESADDADRALKAYTRLSTVYRGDLLPGDVYDDWFAPLRDRCRFDFVDAMVAAAELLLERDDPCEALVYARRALHVDPLREDLYQVVMRCSIVAGQRSSAIDTFLQCRSRLADDLGLDPSAETMALYQEIIVMEDSPRYDDFGLS